ncbi:hypothetical protein D3C86_194500 [compost metagenome]
MGGHGHAQVGGLQHGGVPGGNVFETVVDAMVAHVADHFLGAGNRDRRFRSDLASDVQHAFEHRVLVAVDAIDQADAARFFGAEGATGVSQLTQHAVTDDPWQPLQSANIGGHADIDFLDRELGVFGGVTHIARGDQIDGATQAITLNGSDDRFAAVVDGVERGLQGQNFFTQQARVAANVFAQFVGDAGEHHQVDAGGKVFTVAAEHHHAHFVGVVDPLEDLDDLAPECRVHRVDLFRTIDLHMGDVVGQFDAEGGVLSHGSDPLPG